jgi:phytoene synthase
MQLTNILRDVGEDRRMGRVYLPARAMAECGVVPEDLDRGAPTPGFIALWERYARIAEAWYAESLAAVPLFDRDSRRPLRVAGKAYRAILHEVRRHGYDCLVHRNAVPAWRKLLLLLGGLLP